MKHTEHYRMYTEVFGLDVPLTQRSTCLTPPALVPTVDKAYEIILQDTLQVSLDKHKSREEQEARENVELVNKHLASEEIEKMIPDTRLEPRSDKESPEVESTNDEEVEITNVVIPVNVNEEEDEITDEVKSFDTLADHLQEVMVESLPIIVDTHIKEQVKKQVLEHFRDQVPKAIDNHIPTQVDASVRSYMSGHILHVHPVQSQTPYVPEQQYQLYLSMKNDPQLQQQDVAIWLALQMKESSSRQVNEEERGSSTSGNQEQEDNYDFWTDSYASDDDEIPSKHVSQYIMEEVSLTIDEAKLKRMADEMLRQRCTSGDEHQYHIDQMKNLLKNPEAPALSLINQDLLYLKKGSSGPEKIVLSLHKFPEIIFNDDDTEERTSRWNPHAKIFYIKKQKEPRKPKEEVYSNSKIIQVIKTYWELGHEHKFIKKIVVRRANDCIMSITKPNYKNLNKNDIEDIYLLIINDKCMSWLDVYDEPIGYIEDKVDNLSPQSTPQVLPSFEVYTPPVTYLEKVDEAIGIPMEVDPLDHTKLEDLGLNHDLFLSSKEIPSVDEPEPQLLPNFSPLDVNLGDNRGNRTHPSTHSVRLVLDGR
ncbi:hypothetical protein Tco_0365643 [Tanacetum coccineum]